MIGCNTHLLKHMKQAILVWSFRQNIFPGCYLEKTSKIGRAVDIVKSEVKYTISTISMQCWMKFPEDPPFRISGGATVWHLDKLYLIGGYTVQYNNTIQSYNAVTIHNVG